MGSVEHVPNTVIRSGWLWRQSSFLRKWKRSWFILWNSGRLMCYDDPNATVAKRLFFVPHPDTTMLTADACFDIGPPETLSRECLFGIENNQEKWYLAADTSDEAVAWIFALNEVKRNMTPTYQTYYPDQTYYYRGYGPYRVRMGPNDRVVYVDRRRDPGDDAALGLLAGATLCCFPFFWPFMCWPWFWYC